MDKKDKEKIGQQLIAQAENIRNEEDDVQIIADAVNACQALLRIVDKNIPKNISNSDFEDILSGYVGLTARIKYFYQNNSEYVSDSNSKLLNELLSEINSFQRRKSELDIEYEEKMDEAAGLRKEVESTEKEVLKVREEYETVKSAKEALDSEIEKLTQDTNTLKTEEEKLRNEVENFEAIIENLTIAINKLNEQYAELTAYFTEFNRVKEGIQQDGYIDVVDFTNKVQAQIEDGSRLMNWCDKTLKSLLTDIEILQDKIEKKRKAGV